ncbi:hypothetical protein [Methylocystis sp. B8]|uniref:hypothetical protein n=1 Tax=Methylocystis sp. B8 TaxID=544938 RepID=UPI0010FD290C|nr:hypothetical protein [Methylocystis sp. B8]TLG72831.1 hypothetical protein FEV16_13870 [Methylocystis sp. B8]
MKVAVFKFAAYAVVCGLWLGGVEPALAASGQDFPNATCACKGCGQNKSDLTGKCPDVCKDKTVYTLGDKAAPAPAAKGKRDRAAKTSEPADLCKAARMKLPKGWMRAEPPAAKSH